MINHWTMSRVDNDNWTMSRVEAVNMFFRGKQMHTCTCATKKSVGEADLALKGHHGRALEINNTWLSM